MSVTFYKEVTKNYKELLIGAIYFFGNPASKNWASPDDTASWHLGHPGSILIHIHGIHRRNSKTIEAFTKHFSHGHVNKSHITAIGWTPRAVIRQKQKSVNKMTTFIPINNSTHNTYWLHDTL